MNRMMKFVEIVWTPIISNKGFLRALLLSKFDIFRALNLSKF